MVHVKPSAENKVILVVGGHASHKTLVAVEYARDNSVVMISLPPHSTHYMQPLDKTIFGPLKTAYNVSCDKWMVSHPVSQASPRWISQRHCGLNAQRLTSPQSGQSSVAEVDQPGTSQAQPPMLLQFSQSNAAQKLLTSISQLPKAEQSRARKRRVESAEVLTGSPYKKILVDKKSLRCTLLRARNQMTCYQKVKRNLPVVRTNAEDDRNSRDLLTFPRRNLPTTSLHHKEKELQLERRKIRRYDMAVELWNSAQQTYK